MLAAIWSLTYPSCSSSGRILLRWEILTRAFSKSNHISSAAITLPPRSLAADKDKDPDVFEDPSSDYINIVNESFPPPPSSTISLIQSGLTKIYSEPLLGDVLIFEDISDPDYAASTPIYAIHNPSSISNTLSSLVLAGRSEEALKVLIEIQKADLDVPFSHIYEIAAQAVLSDVTLEPSERVSQFVSWFSLIPPAHQADRNRKFLRTRSLIFQSLSANVSLAVNTAVILASKGYAALIIAEAIPFIMRFAPPDVSVQFVTAFEHANEAYWREYNPVALPHQNSRVVTKVRSAAVKSLANSGYLDRAIALLPDPPRKRFRLTARTYDVLLDALHSSRDPRATTHISLVKSLQSRKKFTTPSTTEGFEEDVLKGQIDRLSAEVDPHSMHYVGKTMATSLDRLTTTLQDRHNLPPIATIVNFLDAYVSTGRSAAVATLRRKALNAHPICASHFLLSEMVYYRSQNFNHLIIQTFADHFYLSGVPRDDIIYQCRQTKSNEESVRNAFDVKGTCDNQAQATLGGKTFVGASQHPRTLFDHLRRGKYNDRYRQKLWPTHAHRNLVWSSLLSLVRSDAAIEGLYAKLLRFASRHETAPDPPTNKALSYLTTPPSQTRVVDTEAFTPFLKRMSSSQSNPDRGYQILSDMVIAGITPSIHHFTQIAGSYARAGNARNTFLVLDMLERQHPQEGPVHPARYGRNPGDDLPRPDLALYTSAMRGFIMRGSAVDAREVEARLRRRFVHVPGQHPPLDRTLVDLEQLKRRIME